MQLIYYCKTPGISLSSKQCHAFRLAHTMFVKNLRFGSTGVKVFEKGCETPGSHCEWLLQHSYHILKLRQSDHGLNQQSNSHRKKHCTVFPYQSVQRSINGVARTNTAITHPHAQGGLIISPA